MKLFAIKAVAGVCHNELIIRLILSRPELTYRGGLARPQAP